jgi:hypothetical protein
VVRVSEPDSTVARLALNVHVLKILDWPKYMAARSRGLTSYLIRTLSLFAIRARMIRQPGVAL